MPSLLLHAAAVQRLAETGARELPEDMARALHEDLEYARFGAFLPDLPWLDGPRVGMVLFGKQGPQPHFAELFHEKAPVTMGLKMAELVAMGALVGTEAGLAFVCGYFTHLCMDRVLYPVVNKLVARHRRAREDAVWARRRIEWTQANFYLRERHGRELVGDPVLRSMLRILKRRTPARGVGRGLYELLRVSAQEILGEAPTKAQVDGWVRGLYLYGLLLASPLGRARFAGSDSSLAHRELYRGDDVDFPAEVDRGLALARQVLEQLDAYVSRGTFTARARQRFLAEFPEGSPGYCAA